MNVGDCGVGGKPHERMTLSTVTVFFLISFFEIYATFATPIIQDINYLIKIYYLLGGTSYE